MDGDGFVTIAGALAGGEATALKVLKDNFARTGIDVMVTEGIRINNYHLEKLTETV